jgi:hypothetical protein
MAGTAEPGAPLRPDASSLRAAALRSMKRKAKVASVIVSELSSNDTTSASERLVAPDTGVQLDYTMDEPLETTQPLAQPAKDVGDVASGEMEEGEISEDEATPIPPSAPPENEQESGFSEGQMPPGEHALTNLLMGDPPPHVPESQEILSATPVMPALNLAHFGVDDKHARPGLSS